jgi:hypothetical protein
MDGMGRRRSSAEVARKKLSRDLRENRRRSKGRSSDASTDSESDNRRRSSEQSRKGSSNPGSKRQWFHSTHATSRIRAFQGCVVLWWILLAMVLVTKLGKHHAMKKSTFKGEQDLSAPAPGAAPAQRTLSLHTIKAAAFVNMMGVAWDLLRDGIGLAVRW